MVSLISDRIWKSDFLRGGNKMNKCLLVWNIAITVLLLGTIAGGCSSIDPEISYTISQAKSNRDAIEQLANAVNENRQLINTQAQQALVLQTSIETSLQQLTASLQEYVQEYVRTQIEQ
jgi:hypothetical protein